jgi:exosortase
MQTLGVGSLSTRKDAHRMDRTRLAALGGLALLLAWSYFPTLDWMVGKWISEPQYSHGFLVPVFAGWLLWRRGPQIWTNLRPTPLLGTLVLLVALAARWLSGALLFHQLDVISLMISLLGIALMVGGTRLARYALPSVLFLIFMMPLPFEWERNVGGPLKTAATQATTYLLQTLGYPAIAEGNIIRIDEVTLGVVDACSGLKMLVTFAAFAGGAVLLLERTLFEKLMIILGVIPIAVFINVLRVTATGIVYTMLESKGIRDTMHDVFGWLMMPGGLALLALQLWILTRLLVLPPRAEIVPLRPAVI